MDESPAAPKGPLRVIGRYALYEPIAAGGMATVHLGRLLGPVGFSRTVAIKRSHPEFACEPEFVTMFVEEAKLAARIRHPNVVSTLDVVALKDELFLVMDYVQGESLSRLMRASKVLAERIPPAIACTILAGALHGLHAAHEAKGENGVPLNIVHRDVSPQNILVGVDGIARVADFGVAKASGRVSTTREGQIKGKLAYLAPEQLNGVNSRQSDVYAATVVLWEALTGERLFQAENPGELLNLVLHRRVPAPSEIVKELPPGLDEIVLKGLSRYPAARFATAREMAIELERKGGLVSAVEVGEWVERIAQVAIASRAQMVAEIENYSHHGVGETSSSPRRGSAEEAAAIAAARRLGEIPQQTTATATVPEMTNRGKQPSSGEISSSPTQSSMASISAYPPEARTNRARFAVLGGAGAAILALAMWTGLRSSGSAQMKAAPEPAASFVAAPVAAPTPTASASVSAPEMTAEPSSSAARPETPAPSKPRPVLRPAAPKKPALNCDPPYFLDPQGIRHMRRECLK